MGAVLLAALGASAASGQPQISLVGSTLEIAAPPNSSVLVTNVSRTPVGFIYQASVGAEVLGTDASGQVSWAPPGGIPEQSLWFVIEPASGLGVLAFPDELEPEEMNLSLEDVIQTDGEGSARLLYLEGRRVQIWMVRPGVGIWQVDCADGGEGDLDGADDGLVLCDLALAEAIAGTTGAAGQATTGDVLVAVDTATLRYFMAQVGS